MVRIPVYSRIVSQLSCHRNQASQTFSICDARIVTCNILFVKIFFYFLFSICQSTGSIPFAFRNLFARLNGRLPKNPLYADSGLGWGASKIRCLEFVSIDFFICAGRPHRINTIGLSCSFKMRIAASVNSSQPIPRWEFAWWARTVRTVFKSSTP